MKKNLTAALAAPELPSVVTVYLRAHREHDIETALQCFSPDAVVIDDAKTYRGHDSIREWLKTSSSEFTYTIELTGAQHLGEDRFVATHHLVGNFPGAHVDLDYIFELRLHLIAHLHIEVSAPH